MVNGHLTGSVVTPKSRPFQPKPTLQHLQKPFNPNQVRIKYESIEQT